MNIKQILEKELEGYVRSGYFTTEDEWHDELQGLVDSLAEENQISPVSYSARSIADEYEGALQMMMATFVSDS